MGALSRTLEVVDLEGNDSRERQGESIYDNLNTTEELLSIKRRPRMK